jgi:hypothetical protein
MLVGSFALVSLIMPMITAGNTAIAQMQNSNTTTTQGTSMMAPNTTSGNNNATTSTKALELKFFPQPIWEEKAKTTGRTPINQTYSRVDFTGHGNMTVPDVTGKKINMTNTGYAIVITGKENVYAYGREHVFSAKDNDTTAITYYEILQYNATTHVGRGIIIAVFDNNGTGSLAPFNRMVVAGTHLDDPNDKEGATITLWKWEVS